MDTCKLHQSFYIIKTIFCKKRKKKIETWQYSISVYKHNNCAKISQTKQVLLDQYLGITYQFLNIPDSQRCHCPSRNKYKNIKGMTYSQRKDIKIARAKKNYEKIQKYEKMAKGLVTSKSGKIYLLSHTFFHCIIVNWNMIKQCKQHSKNRLKLEQYMKTYWGKHW